MTTQNSFFKDVLDFWYSNTVRPLWFSKDSVFDKKVYSKFHRAYEKAKSTPLDDKQDSPENALATVIVLDQFPRNMFRDTPKAFLTDPKALKICRQSIKNKLDERFISDEQRFFLYMPFMHSETIEDQEEGLRMFSSLSDNGKAHEYALAHRDIIAKFGRFPHRNAILGRISTPEEIDFLKEPSSSF